MAVFVLVSWHQGVAGAKKAMDVSLPAQPMHRRSGDYALRLSGGMITQASRNPSVDHQPRSNLDSDILFGVLVYV